MILFKMCLKNKPKHNKSVVILSCIGLVCIEILDSVRLKSKARGRRGSLFLISLHLPYLSTLPQKGLAGCVDSTDFERGLCSAFAVPQIILFLCIVKGRDWGSSLVISESHRMWGDAFAFWE